VLNTFDQVLDLGGWPAPKDQTVPRIYIARLNGRIAQLRQDRVDAHTSKALIKQFGLLLDISRRTVQTILRLYLRLSCMSIIVCYDVFWLTDRIVLTCCYQGIIWVAESRGRYAAEVFEGVVRVDRHNFLFRHVATRLNVQIS
jgi:hypothetical protein